MGFAGSTPINQRLTADILVETGDFNDLQNAILAGPANPTRKWKVVARGNFLKITKTIVIPSYVSLDLSDAFLKADSNGVLASTLHYALIQIGKADGIPASNIDVIGGVLDCNLQAINGIYFNTFGGNSISDVLIFGVLVKNGGRDASFLISGTDILVFGCTSDGFTPQTALSTTTGGFYVTATSALRCKVVDCIARNGARNINISANGFVADDGTTQITWDGCTAYNNQGTGFLLVASSGTHAKEWAVLNSRSMDNINASAQPKGFSIQYCDGLQIQNCFASHNGGTGIYVDNCPDALISTNICKNNGVNSSPDAGIRTTNSTRLNIFGNRCYDDQGVQTQAYGILLDSGTTTAFIEGNVLLLNITTGLKINAGTDHWIINNRGYNPGPLGLLGLDNRTGVTAVDGSPIILYAVPAASSLLFRITADIFATAFTSGTATYTITWTENAVTRTLVVTATALNTLGTGTDLINPDASTNITAQLTGVFTATVKVSAVVEQLA